MDEKAGKYGAFLPRSYLAESRWRLDGYRRIAEAATSTICKNCAWNGGTVTARGPSPSKDYCSRPRSKSPRRKRRIRMVETQGGKLMLQQGQDYIMVSGQVSPLDRSRRNFYA